MGIHLVLNFDGLLGTSQERKKQESFFKNKGAIVTAADKAHSIYPGVIEFIQRVYQIPDVQVSFFTAEDRKRDVDLVHELLKLALPEDQFHKIRPHVRILSKTDLTKPTDQEDKYQYEQYGLMSGAGKKDISKALSVNDLLKNAVLMECDSTLVKFGQAKNFLYVPHLKGAFSHYSTLPYLCDLYQPNGYKLFRCTLANKETEEEINSVKRKEHILVVKAEKGFKIGFCDKSGTYREEVLNENSELFSQLNKIHEGTIEDKTVTKNIYDFVASFDGQTQKICRRANRIFYATGVLFQAMENAKSQGISISEALFQLQFKLNQETGTYQPYFRDLKKVDELYLLGLKKLKEVNNNIELITPHDYVKFVQ